MDHASVSHHHVNFGGGFPPFALEEAYLEHQRRKSVHHGEFGLMLAILEDAIHCYVKYAPAKDQRGRQEFKEAEEWIFRPRSDWLFSFENICEILAIAPEYLRHGLLRRKERVEQAGHHRKLTA